MADLGFTVNTDELPDAQDFSPLPADNYLVVLTNSKLLPTNKTKDAMQMAGVTDYESFRKNNPKAEGFLNLEMDVQGGTYAGRKLFHNLNLINDSQQAAEIAAGELKQILIALGMKTFSGKSEELHGKRLMVTVAVDPAKPYKDKRTGETKPGFAQNKCKKFFAVGATTASANVAASPAVGVAKGPWSR